jgi:predicted peptidase
MRRIFVLFLAALCIAPLLTQSPTSIQTGFLVRSITLDGKAYRYQVYVPLDFTPAKQWSVIVDLHGNGAQGTDGLRPTAHGFAATIRANRSAFPVVALIPQAQPDFRWLYPEMERLVIAELDATITEFHGDPLRVYLTGFSMGATGVYRIAAKWPDRFAALVTIAGRVETMSAQDYQPRDIEVDREANPFEATSDPFAALANRIKTLPIWVAHGDADRTVPVDQSRHLIPALKAAKADVRYVEYPGAGHTGTAEKVYGDPEVVRWLLAQHRPTKATQ